MLGSPLHSTVLDGQPDRPSALRLCSAGSSHSHQGELYKCKQPRPSCSHSFWAVKGDRRTVPPSRGLPSRAASLFYYFDSPHHLVHFNTRYRDQHSQASSPAIPHRQFSPSQTILRLFAHTHVSKYPSLSSFPSRARHWAPKPSLYHPLSLCP